MKISILITFLIISICLQAQDCKNEIYQYIENIDTTTRKVYRFADTMPSILSNDSELLMKFSNINCTELTCCPIYVWYGFVVETDESLSNIYVCPILMDCENNINSEKDKQNVINQFTKIISEFETTSGLINNEKVAVVYISRIHYECWDWDNN